MRDATMTHEQMVAKMLENPDVRAEHEQLNHEEFSITGKSNHVITMKKINSGKLRAIGYDARTRTLQVQLDNGNTLQHSAVSEDLWRRLSSSGAAWSFYRDNIEEEFVVKKVSGSAPAGKNPRDDLFGQK